MVAKKKVVEKKRRIRKGRRKCENPNCQNTVNAKSYEAFCPSCKKEIEAMRLVEVHFLTRKKIHAVGSDSLSSVTYDDY